MTALEDRPIMAADLVYVVWELDSDHAILAAVASGRMPDLSSSDGWRFAVGQANQLARETPRNPDGTAARWFRVEVFDPYALPDMPHLIAWAETR